jgi:hypothetical protein
MSQKEAPRMGLLKALGARRVTGREVATALDVTMRQVWRQPCDVLRLALRVRGHRHEGYPAQRTLSRSRRPSPIMLTARTVRPRNRPGNRMIQKASCT